MATGARILLTGQQGTERRSLPWSAAQGTQGSLLLTPFPNSARSTNPVSMGEQPACTSPVCWGRVL